ncbi:MAG TPA: hypothetical protein VK968_20040 [Roseimicrobium sp.]|nr:hypothetical protein [Roseimicrobium sp.]
MKSTSIALFAVVAVLVSACGKKEAHKQTATTPAPSVAARPISLDTTPAEPVATPAVPAPTEVATAPTLAESENLGGKGRPLTDQEKMLLNYGIGMFKQEKGRYPSNIDEAVKAGFIARVPELPAGQKLLYDAEKGIVTISTN